MDVKELLEGFPQGGPTDPEGVRGESDAFVLDALEFVDQFLLLSGVPELAAVGNYWEGYGVVCQSAQSPLRGGMGDVRRIDSVCQ